MREMHADVILNKLDDAENQLTLLNGFVFSKRQRPF